jgi:3-dehydroquinate synthetase
VIDLLGHDKKRDAQGIRMVLLRGIGAPTVHHVDGNDIAVGLGAVGL